MTISNSVDSRAEFTRLESVSLSENKDDQGCGVYRLSRTDPASQDIRVETRCDKRSPLPSQVLAPELDTSRRLSAALESSREDPPFQRALPIALWLLRAASANQHIN